MKTGQVTEWYLDTQRVQANLGSYIAVGEGIKKDRASTRYQRLHSTHWSISRSFSVWKEKEAINTFDFVASNPVQRCMLSDLAFENKVDFSCTSSQRPHFLHLPNK